MGQSIQEWTKPLKNFTWAVHFVQSDALSLPGLLSTLTSTKLCPLGYAVSIFLAFRLPFSWLKHLQIDFHFSFSEAELPTSN